MVREPQTYAEFWPYYLSQHADPRCRLLHVAGTTLAAGCLAASPLAPPLLLAAPAVGYTMSWIGHFAFERNRPASWHSPRHFWWSFLSDWRMTYLTLTGQLSLRQLADS